MIGSEFPVNPSWGGEKMNKRSMAISLLSIVMLTTSLIGTTQAFLWKRPNVTPVEILLTPGGYTNFYDAWSYKNKLLRANDLATTDWAATLHSPDEDIAFISTMILNALVKMEINLETYEGPPMVPVVGSWGMAVVKATWVIEGATFEGQIIYKYDYVDVLDWNIAPFYKDEWIPRPTFVECHYHGVLNGPMGQQLMLSGANDAGEFLVKLEGYLTEY